MSGKLAVWKHGREGKVIYPRLRFGLVCLAQTRLPLFAVGASVFGDFLRLKYGEARNDLGSTGDCS